MKFWNKFYINVLKVHFLILQLIPGKHFGRKNLGFLFAIAHGIVLHNKRQQNIKIISNSLLEFFIAIVC